MKRSHWSPMRQEDLFVPPVSKRQKMQAFSKQSVRVPFLEPDDFCFGNFLRFHLVLFVRKRNTRMKGYSKSKQQRNPTRKRTRRSKLSVWFGGLILAELLQLLIFNLYSIFLFVFLTVVLHTWK